METQDKKASKNKSTSFRSDISIAALDRHNWETSVEQLAILKEMISTNDDKYPGIDLWFAKKVIPGLQSGERKAYIAFDHERPVAAAIMKLGTSAKLCHLRIDEHYQDVSLGQILLVQMTLDVIDYAREIHFTLPETLWAAKKGFFKSFGFSQASRTSLGYRKGEAELSCSAPISKVYSAVLRKLPNLLGRVRLGEFPGQSDLLMSMKANFAEKIMNGSKSIEIRKRFSDKWAHHDVVLYASKPTGSLVGRATVNSITKGRPDILWSRFGERIGCERWEFDAYVGDAKEITAIEFKNVSRYERSLPVSEISNLLHQKLTPPQSFLELTSDKTRGWVNAIYLAGSFQHKPGFRTNSKFQA